MPNYGNLCSDLLKIEKFKKYFFYLKCLTYTLLRSSQQLWYDEEERVLKGMAIYKVVCHKNHFFGGNFSENKPILSKFPKNLGQFLDICVKSCIEGANWAKITISLSFDNY